MANLPVELENTLTRELMIVPLTGDVTWLPRLPESEVDLGGGSTEDPGERRRQGAAYGHRGLGA